MSQAPIDAQRPTATPAETSPGTRGYWLAGLIALGGVAAGGWLCVDAIRGILSSDMRRMEAPGEMEFEVTEPDTYNIYHEHRSVFRGRVYRNAPSPPAGLTVTVVRKADGRHVELTSPQRSETYSIMDERAGKLMMRFRADRPGAYAVEATYGDADEPTETVLAVGRLNVLNRVSRILLGVLLAGLGVLAGLTLLVVTLARRMGGRSRPRDVARQRPAR